VIRTGLSRSNESLAWETLLEITRDINKLVLGGSFSCTLPQAIQPVETERLDTCSFPSVRISPSNSSSSSSDVYHYRCVAPTQYTKARVHKCLCISAMTFLNQFVEEAHNASQRSFFLDPEEESIPDSNRHSPPPSDTMKEVVSMVPTHPIASMQDAFAESMREASETSTPSIPKARLGNAPARRQILLDQDISEETHASRWRQKPGQQYHEMWKLMAQISFGIYLLLNGIAKDDGQVMSILQGHVDEVDEFLQTTLEDFDLALDDIEERLKFLRLPLENISIFDAMLEDRQFRLQIVSGNERIEHVITRTAKAMNDALKDVKQGLNACKEFTIYLAEEAEDPVWRIDNPDMEQVYIAMKGNVDGWYKAYVSLQTKGNHLGVALVQLGSIVAEMDRRAGEISRKTRVCFASTNIVAFIDNA